MRVALYIRVANADQLTVDAQLEYLKKYAEEKKYEVAAIYALNGISGMKITQYLNDLLHLAKAANVKKIVTRDPTRISRDTIQFIGAEMKFRSAGIELEYSEHPEAQRITDCAKHLIDYFTLKAVEI